MMLVISDHNNRYYNG